MFVLVELEILGNFHFTVGYFASILRNFRKLKKVKNDKKGPKGLTKLLR